MLHHLNTRYKKYRHKEREDWMWYEDPYKAKLSKGWDEGMAESHGRDIPAPNPSFGIEPPVHSHSIQAAF